jgi:hypothetical protein
MRWRMLHYLRSARILQSPRRQQTLYCTAVILMICARSLALVCVPYSHLVFHLAAPHADLQVAASVNSLSIALGMAVFDNGSLAGWGQDEDGRISSAVAAFSGQPSGSSALQVAACTSVLVVDRDGNVRGFGGNRAGELNLPAPSAAPGSALGPVAAAAAGLSMSAALGKNGGVRLWGRLAAAMLPPALMQQQQQGAGAAEAVLPPPDPAQLLPGWSAEASSPTRTAAAVPVLDVALGVHHTVLVLPPKLTPTSAAAAAAGTTVGASGSLNSQEVYAYGAEFYGNESNAFDDSTGVRALPTWRDVAASGGDGTVTHASAGRNHTLLLIGPAGRVVSYGSAADGLSDGDVPVAARSGVMAISAGWGFSVALKADGRTLLVWGNATLLTRCGLADGGNASTIASGLGLNWQAAQTATATSAGSTFCCCWRMAACRHSVATALGRRACRPCCRAQPLGRELLPWRRVVATRLCSARTGGSLPGERMT